MDIRKTALGRTSYAICFVALGTIVGKWCQFAALACLEDRLGFDGASAVALVPFLGLLLLLRRKYPRAFSFRSEGR